MASVESTALVIVSSRSRMTGACELVHQLSDQVTCLPTVTDVLLVHLFGVVVLKLVFERLKRDGTAQLERMTASFSHLSLLLVNQHSRFRRR